METTTNVQLFTVKAVTKSEATKKLAHSLDKVARGFYSFYRPCQKDYAKLTAALEADKKGLKSALKKAENLGEISQQIFDVVAFHFDKIDQSKLHDILKNGNDKPIFAASDDLDRKAKETFDKAIKENRKKPLKSGKMPVFKPFNKDLWTGARFVKCLISAASNAASKTASKTASNAASKTASNAASNAVSNAVSE